MAIMQIKCDNARPRRNDDLAESSLHMPMRSGSMKALQQILESYQNRSQPNGQHKPASKANRLSTRPPSSPSSPQTERTFQSATEKLDKIEKAERSEKIEKIGNLDFRKSVSPYPRKGSTSMQPKVVRIGIVGSDAAVHNVLTGYLSFFPSLTVNL